MNPTPLAIAVTLSLAVLAEAETFSIPDTGVSFTAPEGFTRLTKDEIALKYPSNRAPAFVVGNERRTTTIAYDVKPHEIPADKLGEVKASFEQLFARLIPGLEWKERKIIELQKQNWIFFEMTSRAVDTDIHNLMLATGYEGKMLVFNFNSTREEFPKVEAALRKSIESITIKSR